MNSFDHQQSPQRTAATFHQTTQKTNLANISSNNLTKINVPCMNQNTFNLNSKMTQMQQSVNTGQVIDSGRESLNDNNRDWIVNIPNGEGGSNKLDRLGTETDECEEQAKSTITIEKRSKNETGSNCLIKSDTKNNLAEPKLADKKNKVARNIMTQSNSSRIMVSYKSNEISSNSKTTNKQLQTDTRFEKSSYKSEALLFTQEPERNAAIKFSSGRPSDLPTNCLSNNERLQNFELPTPQMTHSIMLTLS